MVKSDDALLKKEHRRYNLKWVLPTAQYSAKRSYSFQTK